MYGADRVVICLAVLVIALIGFVRKTINVNSALREYKFTCDFRQKFYKYLQLVFGYAEGVSEAESLEALDFLLRNSYKMQGILGGYGIVRSFKPPYSNAIYLRYEVVLNAIPEIESITYRFPLGSMLSSDSGLRSEYAKLVDNTLIRYEGVLEERLKTFNHQRWNPIIMLRDGIEALLLPVFYLLLWFGLISSNTINMISHSYPFKILSFIIFFAGALSSIMGIALGWDEFLSMVSRIAQKNDV